MQVLVITLWYLAYFSSCGLVMSYAVTCEINRYNMRKKFREYANTIGLDLHSLRTVSSLTYTIFTL